MYPQTIEKATKRCIDFSTSLGALQDELPPNADRVIVECVNEIDEMQRWPGGRLDRRAGELHAASVPSRIRALANATTRVAHRAGPGLRRAAERRTDRCTSPCTRPTALLCSIVRTALQRLPFPTLTARTAFVVLNRSRGFARPHAAC